MEVNFLELIMSDDGQVIVGTERETSVEDKANIVIRLIEKRRCLSSEKYNEQVSGMRKDTGKAAESLILSSLAAFRDG